MEQYFPVISTSSLLRKVNDQKEIKHSASRYHPYKANTPTGADGVRGQPSSSVITKHLLSTLTETSNPITHSDISKRTDVVISTSTGHQVNEGQRQRGLYLEDRERKLAIQRDIEPASNEPQVLKHVRVYINGYLNDTTDIEMKRIVTRAGGQIVATPSRCTHILTSQHLSGSKTHNILTSKSRNKFYVVKPEWVTDSIRTGKRRPEREYTVIKNGNTIESYSAGLK